MAIKDELKNASDIIIVEAMNWLHQFNKEHDAASAPDFYHAAVEEKPLDTPNL